MDVKPIQIKSWSVKPIYRFATFSISWKKFCNSDIVLCYSISATATVFLDPYSARHCFSPTMLRYSISTTATVSADATVPTASTVPLLQYFYASLHLKPPCHDYSGVAAFVLQNWRQCFVFVFIYHLSSIINYCSVNNFDNPATNIESITNNINSNNNDRNQRTSFSIGNFNFSASDYQLDYTVDLFSKFLSY